jgi:hypothetical protein
MSVEHTGGDSLFRCEACPAYFIGEGGSTWDEIRIASVRAAEAGWEIRKKKGGRVEVLCPNCSAAGDLTYPSVFEIGDAPRTCHRKMWQS